MDEKKCERLAALLANSRKAVFFGGAGVSTESGVKDYRSQNGLYNTVREYGVSPETILSHDFFMKRPEVFFDFYYKYFLKDAAEPNAAHKALAQLERRGHVAAVITQNIDGLHQRAGSKNVIELHGTALENDCMGCGRAFPTAGIAALAGGVPRCPHCGGRIKPRVVLYGEQLPEAAVKNAVNAIAAADLLVIGGTSLTVYPAAGFIRYYAGKELALINRDETTVDDAATLVLRDPIGQVFADVMRRFE